MLSHRLGTVKLEPAGEVVAGTVGQWTLIYSVGSYGIDEGGTLKLSQRFASDWQVPQFTDTEKPGYTSVWTDGDAKLNVYYSKKANERPWMNCLVIDVYDGSLKPGEIVKIVLGDQRFGSPGIRAQTFQETAHEFRFLVDPTNACVTRILPTSPKFQIVPGEIRSLTCIVPTQVEVNQNVALHITGVDAWGNPTPPPEHLSISWQGTGEVVFSQSHMSFLQPGTGYVRVKAGEMVCDSNPITANEQPVKLKKYWGDLHAQSDTTVGTGTVEEYFQFARDRAHLDFSSHQGNDFQVTDDMWSDLNLKIKQFHQDHQFVVFPGYEWSGNTAAGGDRNIFFRHEGFPIMRSCHWQVPDVPEDSLTPAHPASMLFERMHDAVGVENVVIGAHVGGRYADLPQYFDQDLCLLVEVCSCWGIFEWLLWDAYRSGQIVGVMCNSDGHKGRPGAEFPGAGDFGLKSGLTCVLVPELTRDAVFDALRNRRCYGTTGPRIDLSFELDGFQMGSVLPWRETGRISGFVKCTSPVESLQLFCGEDIIHEVKSPAFSNLHQSNRIRVSWGGARIRGRAKRVVWDGSIQLKDAEIVRAEPFAFDTALDGILDASGGRVTFRSSTMGDRDGIDLWLNQGEKGQLIFESPICKFSLGLKELISTNGRYFKDLGGLDVHVCVEKYPDIMELKSLSLSKEIHPPARQRTPYMLKVTQCDGHGAWSSPIYIESR